jgi:hypothetical protein
MTLAWGLKDRRYMLFRKAGGSKQKTAVEDLRDTKWRVSLMMLITLPTLLVATIGGDVPKRMVHTAKGLRKKGSRGTCQGDMACKA